MITNGPVTVYNRAIDPATRGEVFYRSVVAAAFWTSSRAGQRVSEGGLQPKDQATIYIPQSVCAKYVDWVEWKGLTSKAGHWTLHLGDLIVPGSVEVEVGAGVGQVTPTELRDEYGALQVTSFNGDDVGTEAVRHWTVGAA